LAVSYKRSVQV